MDDMPASDGDAFRGIGRHIWETRYRWRRDGNVLETDIEDTWHRVAFAAAAAETRGQASRAEEFLAILRGFRFLPGGRILAGAGTERSLTLFNCFVMGVIEDDMAAIFESLKEGALTMQAGGGVGYDFSTLRPRGSEARASGNVASGPVSFMQVWDAMCGTLLSTGSRRGAMIATLRADHPDIIEFLDAKRDSGVLRHFNLSVQASDAFMRAVERDEEWPLLFPAAALGGAQGKEVRARQWTGSERPVDCAVLARLPARVLWERLARAAHESSEPGLLFVDRMNEQDNLGYRERLTCTNPCGEIPLPPYGACNLGSINLSRFVTAPFTPRAALDLDAIRASACVAVRFLDNIVDCSRFPLPRQAEEERGSRRLGLGVTGLADAFLMLGLHYGSEAARGRAAELMRAIRDTAYRASIALAREKGSFPFFDRLEYLERPFIQALPADLRAGIDRDGIRNSHLLAIAPAGSISILAGNVSSGIEPVFAFRQRRRILEIPREERLHGLENYAWRLWRERGGGEARPPAHFVTALDLDPLDHLRMQAALQPFADNAISKTINVPRDYSFARFEELYRTAWRLGLKGCTAYRDGTSAGQVISADGKDGVS